MSDLDKVLDQLVAGDEASAKETFHNMVVSQSKAEWDKLQPQDAPQDAPVQEDIINEMGDAETELLPGVKDEDNILVIQRGDNADDIDDDPQVVGELYASEKHSDDDIKKVIVNYLKSKNLDTNFEYDTTNNDYYRGEKTADGRPYRGMVVMHWLGDISEGKEFFDQ